MKLHLPGIGLPYALLTCRGCGRDVYAQWLIRYNTLRGKLRLACMGRAERLVARGIIDAHRRIDAPDGEPMDVWVLQARGAEGTPPSRRRTALLIHGLWDSKAMLLPIGRVLATRGFDVVLPDLRAHGRSGGRYVTYGALEVQDLRAVCSALAGEGLIAGPRYVLGFSMGGGIAVQLAATEPETVAGVLALAPLARTRVALHRFMDLVAPFMNHRDFYAAVDRAGEIAGADLRNASAIGHVRRMRCPLTIVHGQLDAVVPHQQGMDLFHAARDPKQFVSIPWAGHKSLLHDRAEVNADLLEDLATRAESQC